MLNIVVLELFELFFLQLFWELLILSKTQNGPQSVLGKAFEVL
jgi:hypothetical protein